MAHDRVGEEGHPPLPVWKGAGRTQSCCTIFEYDPAGWGAFASRPYTRPDYTFNIINQWLRCAATAHSSTVHTFSSFPSCAHSLSCCLLTCASICTRLHTRRTSDSRTLLSHRCRSGTKVSSWWCWPSCGRAAFNGSSSPCRICSRTSSASQLSA